MKLSHSYIGLMSRVLGPIFGPAIDSLHGLGQMVRP